MLTFLIVTVITSLLAVSSAKSWFGIDKLNSYYMVLIRGIIAFGGALSIGLSLISMIGVWAGVISTYIVVYRALKKQQPIFTDEMSFVGWFVRELFGSIGGRVLYILEVIVYLLIVLL